MSSSLTCLDASKMKRDVCPPENVLEYSTMASIEGMLSGVWSEPVIGLSNSSRLLTPASVIAPAIRRTTAKFLTGNLEIEPHIGGLERLLNLSNQESTGTRIIENTNVAMIPATSVIPTERIGIIDTMFGRIRTEKPMIVVAAETKTATPVVRDISITQDL